AALEHYRKLLSASLTRPADALIVELLKLRCAQCLQQLGQPAQATEILERLSTGLSPIIRAVANYRLASIDVENGQFLQARIKAYKAAANLGALENPLGLEADCDFLIARSLTQKALTTYDLRLDITWPDDRPDPFAALSEDQLRALLSSGTGAKTNSTLEPQVRKKWAATAGQVFSATSQGAPLENLLGRVCAVGGFDIQWVSVDLHVRRRPVVLSLAEVSSHRLCEVACGAAGLIARFDGNRVLVHDPITAKSLLVQRQVVNREGISTWRRFLLRRRDDERVPLGHLAVASLYECSSDTAGALREYELVGQRFRDNPVSAVAFLRAAKLRIHLRDYTGARTALLNLLDSNPDPPDADDVYLSLGRANMEAGLLDEGVRVFSKLYHLNLSAWSQQDACLGLGETLYRKADYREANKWFADYVELVKAKRQRPSPKVYLLWGKSLAAVDRFDEAARVFRLALAGAYSTVQRTEALWELAKAEQQRDNFAGSIAALQKIDSKRLGPQQSLNVLLVTAQTYRRMGLPEKAYDILEGGASRISDPQIQFELAVEMSRCQVDAGNPKAALKLLTEAMPHAEPGPKVLSASCELGQICLKAGQVDQAIIVVEDLLRSSCSDDLKRRGLLILGNAYLTQGNYEQAARAFSGTVLEQLGAQEQ
ncbi:MAG: tetratricopeptide repeat protein, partial [Phycisphaerae bacterium]|nr:tetratricopeptide repeat protein [Phycisphaerae bacterium]